MVTSSIRARVPGQACREVRRLLDGRIAVRHAPTRTKRLTLLYLHHCPELSQSSKTFSAWMPCGCECNDHPIFDNSTCHTLMLLFTFTQLGQRWKWVNRSSTALVVCVLCESSLTHRLISYSDIYSRLFHFWISLGETIAEYWIRIEIR